MNLPDLLCAAIREGEIERGLRSEGESTLRMDREQKKGTETMREGSEIIISTSSLTFMIVTIIEGSR